MKMWVLPFLVLLLGTGTAFANLGDDQPAVEKHYGKPFQADPTRDGAVMAHYRKDGFEITVIFVSGRSHSETFERIGSDKLFSDDLLYRFLGVHSGGETWTPSINADGKRCWSRAGAFACYDPEFVLGPNLTIIGDNNASTTPTAKQ